MQKNISVKGARVHNLKNIDVEIPRNKLTVVTGVSGSGKSSLVYNVIYAEAQRKFLDSLSYHAKSRINHLEKADVDSVKGLSPVISISQKKGIKNPRSTVGTITDIINQLRLLFSMVGEAKCFYCKEIIQNRGSSQVAEKIETLPEGTKVEIYAPVDKLSYEIYSTLFEQLQERGYRTIRIGRKKYVLGEDINLTSEKDIKMQVQIGSFYVEKDSSYLKHMIEEAYTVGNNVVIIDAISKDKKLREEFYRGFACPKHKTVMNKIKPVFLSFNSLGACPNCKGLGFKMIADPNLIIDDDSKKIKDILFNQKDKNSTHHKFYRNTAFQLLKYLKIKNGKEIPFVDLPEKFKTAFFRGVNREKIIFKNSYTNPSGGIKYYEYQFRGVCNDLERDYYEVVKKELTQSVYYYEDIMVKDTCPDCGGQKLLKSALENKIKNKSIADLCDMPISNLQEFLSNLNGNIRGNHQANLLLNDIISHLQIMNNLGLSYININRNSDSISGGEIQRVRLSNQIGSELMGMLYILDEPSIGLHAKDSIRLIHSLKQIRDLGNTVVVVEHDLDTIEEADHIIELGPAAGIHGGKISCEGKAKDMLNNSEFLTGQYISGKKRIEKIHFRELSKNCLNIIGATENNLKNIDVKIPLLGMICITGVSGSGKSSLVNEVILKNLSNKFRRKRVKGGKHLKIEGIEHIGDIRNIDQSPIGTSSRSNPATFSGFFDEIRKVFSQTDEAVARDYKTTRFSFNSKDGRCSECEGNGYISIELGFMPDIKNHCPVCLGARYNSETLEIKYQGRNIAEVLELSIEEATEVFKENKLISRKLAILNELGLGYLHLGQSSNTLSGGECQRLKLAKEIGKLKKKSNNLYIMDEPSIGLHMDDIRKLLDCINRLVDAENTVLIIEHHLDIIKCADHIIDLGPEGGDKGGFVVAEGTVEEVKRVRESYTGQYLKKLRY